MRARVSKFTYGSFHGILYDSNDPDHKARSHKVYIDDSGIGRINVFDIILPKVSCLNLSSKVCCLKKLFENTQVSETKEFRRSYSNVSNSATYFRTLSDSVWCYRGNAFTPKWKDVDTGETDISIVYLVSLMS